MLSSSKGLVGEHNHPHKCKEYPLAEQSKQAMERSWKGNELGMSVTRVCLDALALPIISATGPGLSIDV